MINYSIIIPHKNIPHLLQRCLDSIPRREDVQIIVADDNSDTDKVDFENFPGLNDPFVEVIFGKNENGRKGAGYARNLGLERAKGKWLIFADADDFFMPCFNKALDKYIDDENDIIYFKITSVDSDTLQPAIRHQYIINHLSKIKETNDYSMDCNLHTPWGKFIKRKIIIKNNIFFSEVQCANDIYFGAKTVSFAKLKTVSEEEIYCVTSRANSLVKQVSAKSFSIRFKEIYRTIIFLDSIGRKHYWVNDLSAWWIKTANASVFQAILLLPCMIKTSGVIQTMKCIKKSIQIKIKQFLKRGWNFLKSRLHLK